VRTRNATPENTAPDGRALAMLRDLQSAGLKMTPQRLAIVHLFAVDESHPTAQALFERLKPAFPTMSFATVYNTLDALSKAGLSSTLRLGQAARFDPNTSPHHHAICDVCGAISDIPAEPGAPPVDSAVRRAVPGFAVRAVERVYRGACRSCAAGSHSRGASRPHP
jgi:Fe2+ or Zn2+ uptake regulation protein